MRCVLSLEKVACSPFWSEKRESMLVVVVGRGVCRSFQAKRWVHSAKIRPFFFQPHEYLVAFRELWLNYAVAGGMGRILANLRLDGLVSCLLIVGRLTLLFQFIYSFE